jgi:hypothetical protein
LVNGRFRTFFLVGLVLSLWSTIVASRGAGTLEKAGELGPF